MRTIAAMAILIGIMLVCAIQGYVAMEARLRYLDERNTELIQQNQYLRDLVHEEIQTVNPWK